MPARVPIVSACILVLVLMRSGHAEDSQFGDLDFTRLSKPREQFFWKRLKSLAFEEAVLTYCGQPDDFEQRAKQGIRSCVTEAALNKAESFFKSELEASEAKFRQRKLACGAKPDVTGGWLGIVLMPVGNSVADSPGAGVASGARVVSALEDSPAAAADVKAGDVITSVNGENIADPKELSARIRALAPGTNVELSVLRNGVGHTVSVKLGGMAFDRQGTVAFDMPALIASSKEDLKYVSDEVAEMCRKCQTTIWAMFCH